MRTSAEPTRHYQFCAQGFQRPGPYASAANVAVNASIYAGSKSQLLKHITADAQTSKVGTGNEVTMNSKYVPNNMQAAAAYFKKGFYDNSLTFNLESTAASLKVGLKTTSMPSNYWVIFDNFRLYFYGKTDPDNPTAIMNVYNTSQPGHTVYTLDGRRVDANAQLRPGIYVVDGRKMVIR